MLAAHNIVLFSDKCSMHGCTATVAGISPMGRVKINAHRLAPLPPGAAFGIYFLPIALQLLDPDPFPVDLSL